jgi:hypothetical protein
LSSGSVSGGLSGSNLSGVNTNRDPITPRPPQSAAGRNARPPAPVPLTTPPPAQSPTPGGSSFPPAPPPPTHLAQPPHSAPPASHLAQAPVRLAQPTAPAVHSTPSVPAEAGRPTPPAVGAPPSSAPASRPAVTGPAGLGLAADGGPTVTPLVPAPTPATGAPHSPETTGSLTPLLDQLLAEPDPGASSPSRRGFQSLPSSPGQPAASTPRLGDAMSITQASLRRLWNKEA